ncbi:MAG: metallophosphoesterase [Phenylobacterium sp.]|uniref:metallophosphoesterase n=1 Tax=Phenylobacterium sp. TaxID=1871053 RepID=UPI0027267FCF|nr:metallophosphoesterase [Phenylobacterium sp.]MDO8410014.1 metallophosphoesterase [Phenylobacterium sp.]
MPRLTLAALATGLSLGLAALPAGALAEPVSFAVVGDTGYVPSYERYDADEAPLRTLGDYLAVEAADWLEHHPNLDGFTPTPWVFESALGGYMPASGMYPVARAADEVCRRDGCDFAAMVGDNIYPDGATLGADGISDARRFQDMLDSPYGKLGEGVEDFTIYALMGNHDWHISREATMAQMAYLQAHPNFTMPDLYYRAVPKGFEGEVELFVIDTEMLLASTTVHKDTLDAEGREVRTGELETWPDFVKPATPGEKAMVAWLEEALASSTARWKIVMGHHALWSGGGSKYEKAHALRALFGAAVCRYADAYISGDDHMMEAYTDDCRGVAGAPAQPLPLIVSGAGSKYRPLHPGFMAQQQAANPGLTNLFSAGSVWGFAHVKLDGDAMTARLFTTPADMSGRPVEEASFTFPRRSGR